MSAETYSADDFVTVHDVQAMTPPMARYMTGRRLLSSFCVTIRVALWQASISLIAIAHLIEKAS